MARKKKGDDLIGGVVAGVLIALVILLVIAPYVMLIGWRYFAPKAKSYLQKVRNNPAFFWLSEKEKEQFLACARELSDAITRIDSANQAALAAQVRKNKDGSWDGRTRIGRQCKEIVQENTGRVAGLRGRFRELAQTPRTRWTEFHEAYLCSESLRIAFIAWLCAILPSSLIFGESFFSSIVLHFMAPFNFILQFFFDGIHPPYGADFKVLVSSFVVAALAGVIAYAQKNEALKRLAPQPPEVSVDNLTTYEFDLIRPFIDADRVEGISRAALRELLVIVLLFTTVDDNLDRLETFVLNSILASHWQDAWGDVATFRAEVFAHLEQMDGETLYSDVVGQSAAVLARELDARQLLAADALVKKVIWIDNQLADEEQELYAVFHGLLQAAGVTGGAAATAAPATPPRPAAQPLPDDSRRYNLVFDGTLVEGFALEEVKTRLAHLLKVTPDKAEALFTGKRYVLKKGTTRQQGESALSRLRSIGAQSQLVEVES